MSAVREIGGRNLCRLKGLDQRSNFVVVRKSSGLDHNERNQAARRPEARLNSVGRQKALLGWADYFAPDQKEHNGADHRHDEAGRMKGRPGRGLGKEARDQTANDRSHYSKERAFPKAEMLLTRDDYFGDPANDCTDDNGPDYM